jgi:tRNA dimethylallyltransferase
MAALQGEKSMEEALEATKMHHRRYAKRQLTWFRGDTRVQWLEVEESTETETLLARVMGALSA